jgi:putative ABC transport system ATP-binding protein
MPGRMHAPTRDSPALPRSSTDPTSLADHASASVAGKPAAASEPVLQVQGLAKRYGNSTVFAEVHLSLAAGEFVALVGESGVGKSTLLNCIAGLDEAEAGSVTLRGQPMLNASADARALLRRQHLGFVFQAFHVLPQLSVADNVSLPLRLLARLPADAMRAQVQQALADVGLAALGQRMPAQLSGGQLQRVAIARALVHQPALILADEPTGNLDPATAEQVLRLLQERTRALGCACLLATHAEAATRRADRVLRLRADGLRPA